MLFLCRQNYHLKTYEKLLNAIIYQQKVTFNILHRNI